MGVDLYLLPLGSDRPGLRFAHEIITGPEFREDQDAIRKLAERRGTDIDAVSCYVARVEGGENEGERCYGTIREDDYDNPLRCVTARQLAGVLPDGPARAFIGRCAPDRRIVLFWH